MVRVTLRALAAACVLAAVAVGCGDDDDSSAAAFCDGAEAFLAQGAGLDDPSSAAGREAIATAGRLEVPEEIRGDWRTLVDGAEALAESGATDASPSGDLAPDVEAALQEMAAASSDVFAYVEAECDVSI